MKFSAIPTYFTNPSKQPKPSSPQKQQRQALQPSEQRSNVGLLFDELPNIVDGKLVLRHAVTVTDGNSAALQSLVVDSDAQRRANGVLTAAMRHPKPTFCDS